MGYYLRFLATDDAEISLGTIGDALEASDDNYEIRLDEGATGESGELFWDGGVCAEIEINRPGTSGMFEEEIEELKEFLEDADGDAPVSVLAVLSTAKRIVAVRVLFQGRELEPTVAKFDPLWRWLFENSSGLLQADSKGYYDANGLIFEVE